MSADRILETGATDTAGRPERCLEVPACDACDAPAGEPCDPFCSSSAGA